MRFRNIIIANPAKISVRNRQLQIEQLDTICFPVEDIATLMLESRQIQITAAALETLAVSGATVFFCDEKHMPSAQLLAYEQFTRKRKLLFAQFELNKPLQKRLWQSVVRRKILNQSLCLRHLHKEGADELARMADRVNSGDTTNVEGSAAAFYFPRLFGAGFTRGEDRVENAALNYGYAILRGCVARNLVMHGLEPCIGLHHSSGVNDFNLADDMMEPYRPLVDLYVATAIAGDPEVVQLESVHKRALFDLVNYLVCQDEKSYRVSTSIERMTVSLANSVADSVHALELPELIGLERAKDE